MEVKVCALCEYCWEIPEENIDNQEPCPECGSTARQISLHIEQTIGARGSLGGKVKDPSLPSRQKIRVEFFNGYEWSVELEKDIKKLRLIDKRQDHYHEKVEDPDTGEVLHECTEPLNEHKGHGNAK